MSIEKMKLFIDAHDRTKGTFPEKISAEQFGGFYAEYQKATT